MEKIEHTTITTNGINMHVASIGTGPVILFIHGFPELWYLWCHQFLSLSSLLATVALPLTFVDMVTRCSALCYLLHHVTHRW